MIETHPDTIVFQPGTAPAPQPHNGERASGSNDRMDVDSVASSGRRPKPKARPRQNNLQQTGGVFVVRYGYTKNLSKAVQRHRGDYNYVCGENISEMGLPSRNDLLECVQKSSCPRDHSIPQRGDRNLCRRLESGECENAACDNIANGVYGGILEKLPPRGVQFCHPALGNITVAKPPSPDEYTWEAKEAAKNALRFIQKDLRHHIGRRNNAIYLDKRCESPIATVKCDEGGWVSLEWLLAYDLLWCHHHRRVAYPLPRDSDARQREMQRRLQLLIDGNYINYRGGDGKFRLQFLGVRLRPPEIMPPDFNALEPAFSSRMVHVETMMEELRRDRPAARVRTEHLEQTANWVRPWAVRASAGHSVSVSTVMELDPSKFALSASVTLSGQIQGACHATEIYNLNAIVTEGSDMIDLGRTSGRLHSYFGIVPPWDSRNKLILVPDRGLIKGHHW